MLARARSSGNTFGRAGGCLLLLLNLGTRLLVHCGCFGRVDHRRGVLLVKLLECHARGLLLGTLLGGAGTLRGDGPDLSANRE